MHRGDPDRKLNLLGWWLHGLGVLVVLAIAIGAEFVVYRPIAVKARARAHRADQLHNLLRNERQVRAEHARLSRDLSAAREQAAGLQDRIPDEPREADFLAQVSQLAGEVGLHIQDYRPGTVIHRQDYSVLRVDLICEGDYSSICNFLDRISQLPRYSSVISLQIDSAGNRNKYPAKISLELYFAANSQSEADNEEGLDA